jgi:hypothetical protein
MYTYTVEQFKAFVDLEKMSASYLIPLDSPRTLVDLDDDGYNELCCDDAVEDGHLLQDWSGSFEISEGKVCIRVHVADAAEWIDLNFID